jgi:ATP-dependent RNA helicase DOB1
VLQKVEALEKRLLASPVHKNPQLETLYNLCQKKAELAGAVKTAKKELKRAQNVMHMDELKCRKRVLRRLGFASASDVIEVKGRVACEISRYSLILLSLVIPFSSLSLSPPQWR